MSKRHLGYERARTMLIRAYRSIVSLNKRG